MLKIRRSGDRLIFHMGIPIPRKDGLCIETGRALASMGHPYHKPPPPTIEDSDPVPVIGLFNKETDMATV